jgi:hypothetical protein
VAVSCAAGFCLRLPYVTPVLVEIIVRVATARQAVLLGTAKDETCSLEGRERSFELTGAQFDADTLAEYGAIGINVSRVHAIYAGYHNQTVTRRRLFTAWWWAAIGRSSDFSFHCPTRLAAKLLGKLRPHPGPSPTSTAATPAAAAAAATDTAATTGTPGVSILGCPFLAVHCD